MTRGLPTIHDDAAANRESFVYSGHDNLLVMQYARNYNRFLSDLVLHYGQGRGTVVDFGAGVGVFAHMVRDWAPYLICVEPDQTQVAMLTARGFRVASSLSDLADNSVDFVYSLNVFEHIKDDERVMAEIFGKLRRGGRLLVYVPAMNWLYSSMDRRVGHLRRYDLGELTSKLSRAGYRIERAEYMDSLGVPATLAYKLTGNDGGGISVAALKIYDRIIFPLSRALDTVFRRVLGKNALVVVEKAA